MDQMNLRSVSTEHNMSLLQLWTSGMLQNINSQPLYSLYVKWNSMVWTVETQLEFHSALAQNRSRSVLKVLLLSFMVLHGL